MSHSCISPLTSHVTFRHFTANQSRHIQTCHRYTSHSNMSPLYVTFRPVTPNQSHHIQSSILLQKLKVYICRCVHTAGLDTEVMTDYTAYFLCCFPVTNDNDNTMLLMIMITPCFRSGMITAWKWSSSATFPAPTNVCCLDPAPSQRCTTLVQVGHDFSTGGAWLWYRRGMHLVQVV